MLKKFSTKQVVTALLMTAFLFFHNLSGPLGRAGKVSRAHAHGDAFFAACERPSLQKNLTLTVRWIGFVGAVGMDELPGLE